VPDELASIERGPLLLGEKAGYLTGKFEAEGLSTGPLEEAFLRLVDLFVGCIPEEALPEPIQEPLRVPEESTKSDRRPWTIGRSGTKHQVRVRSKRGTPDE
jgi:hypothetical protein